MRETQGIALTRSISRATEILRCVSSGVSTVSEIARVSKYSLSTIHRLLQTLKELGWVTQNRVNHQYYLGPTLDELASQPTEVHKRLIVNSHNTMYHLYKYSGETINLGILANLTYIRLHHIASSHDLRATEEGDRFGMPTLGATGRVLVSQLDRNVLLHALSAINAQDQVERPYIDVDSFLGRIEGIKERGYEVSDGELIDGVVCISAPIHNYRLPAALSIMGPRKRLMQMQSPVVSELIKWANFISDLNKTTTS